MGIPAILAAAMTRVSWGEVANIALQYGPDIVKKIRERLRLRQAAEAEARVSVEELHERVRELENAIIKQEEIIEQQNRNIELLEQIGKTLQARLNIFIVLAAFSLTVSLALLVLVLRR